MLDFSVTDVKALEDKGMNVTDVARSIVSRMEAVPGVMVFKNQTTGLVAISDDAAQLDQVSDLLMKAAAEYRDAANSVLMFNVSNAERFGTAAELQKFLTYVRSRSSGRLSVMVHVSEAMIQQYSQSQEIEKEIDAALEEDRVEVFYQPIFNSAAQRVTAGEALVRIRGRDGKLLSPGLFIPVAETTGQVKALGERVLEKVCGFLRDSAVRELGIRMIDVNLSAVQCDDSAMSGRLSQIVESYGIEPGLINFEITETAVSEVKDVLIENMNALVSKGFSFALDDFGKGESNLMYIVELPCQILKLDMDMSKAYFSNPKARPVVEAIVELAHKLNLSSIAEGIETREEAEGITAAGIDSIQGYYYSRPLPADEFLAYLETSVVPAGEAPAAQPAQTVPAPAETTQRVLEVRSILLVEDNEMNREIATDILEDCGYLVETAEDGSLAVEMVAKAAPGQYDLVLMDIRMPIMDGYEATRRIRQLDESRLAGVPIVALTAQDGEEDRLLAFEAGMDGHIVKPLDAKKLELMLAELAGKTTVS